MHCRYQVSFSLRLPDRSPGSRCLCVEKPPVSSLDISSELFPAPGLSLGSLLLILHLPIQAASASAVGPTLSSVTVGGSYYFSAPFFVKDSDSPERGCDWPWSAWPP